MFEVTLAATYSARVPLLEELAQTLEAGAREALRGVEHIDRVCFRVKDLASFLTKAAKPKYGAPLAEIEDQVAGRAITFFRQDIPIVRERLTERFGRVEHETKEPAGPSEFGYESDHYVFVIPEHLKPDFWQGEPEMPTTFEFQIRTLFMHAWAEPQHDLGYKPGGAIDIETTRELAWVAASAWGADRMLSAIASQLAAPPEDRQ